MTSGLSPHLHTRLEQRLTAELYLNLQTWPRPSNSAPGWRSKPCCKPCCLPGRLRCNYRLAGGSVWRGRRPHLSPVLAVVGSGERAGTSCSKARPWMLSEQLARRLGVKLAGHGQYSHAARCVVAHRGGGVRRLRQPQGPRAGQRPAPAGPLAETDAGAFQPGGAAGKRGAAGG